LRFCDLRQHGRWRRQSGGGEHAVTVDIVRTIPEADIAVAPAHKDHREFGCKRYSGLADQRLFG
jgi:hypothetical protein